MERVGTTRQHFEEARGSAFSRVGKIDEGTHTHRVIVGPVSVDTLWYPTLMEIERDKVVQTYRTLVRPSEGWFLDKVAKLDEQITRENLMSGGVSEEESKKYRSPLRTNRMFRFLVFDRDQDGGGAPTVRAFDYPFTVKDKLEKLQTQKNQKNPQYLEYGLVFMFDVYIIRGKKQNVKSKDEKILTEYDVQAVRESISALPQIPSAFASWKPDSGEPCPWNLGEYFTPAELKAIEDYPGELEDLCKSSLPEEVLEQLKKFPIYLDAKYSFGDKKNDPMFPYLMEQEGYEKLASTLQEGDVNALEEGLITLQLPEGVELTEREKKAQTSQGRTAVARPIIKRNVEETTAEVVEETTEDVKPKLTPRLNIPLKTNVLTKQTGIPARILVKPETKVVGKPIGIPRILPKTNTVQEQKPTAPIKKIWPGKK